MPPAPRHLRRDVWAAVAVVAAAAVVRYRRLSDGLWYDEATTLIRYVRRPWQVVVAPHVGQYLPNDHVLHTVLAKLAYGIDQSGDAPREAMLRAPSWAAASLLPVAVAWPLRGTPAVALVVALAVALHPWLVGLGSEARGYSLLLLLGVVATNLLPRRGGAPGWRLEPPSVAAEAATPVRRSAAYAVTLAAAIYTVPLAVLLVPAHAVAVLTTNRARFRRWAVAAAGGVAVAAALYAPMASAVAAYYRHPFEPTMSARAFLDGLPRTALAGERLPRLSDDPLVPPLPDPPGAAIFWALPAFTLVVGTVVGGLRFPAARPLLATLATVTVLGVLLPLATPAAHEVRFVTWAGPWFCLAAVLLLAAVDGPWWGRGIAVAGVVVLLAQFAAWDLHALPAQPVRSAMQWVDGHAPAGRAVVAATLGGPEAAELYAGDVPHHAVVPAQDEDMFRQAVSAVARGTGRLPWVVVPFEKLMPGRDPAFWADLTRRFVRVRRFDGRLSSVAVYAPRDDRPVAGGGVAGR